MPFVVRDQAGLESLLWSDTFASLTMELLPEFSGITNREDDPAPTEVRGNPAEEISPDESGGAGDQEFHEPEVPMPGIS